jgi:DNA-directed RNA polymerase beta subunit
MEPKDPEKQVFVANLMPARGSWLELEIDKKGRVYVRIDRKRKLPVTVLLRAMGYSTDEGDPQALQRQPLHPQHRRGRHRGHALRRRAR